MILYYILILGMTLLASTASFFLKKSTSGNKITSILLNYNLYLGGFFYVLASIINIYVLQKLPYSIVVPLGSICYIWTMFIAFIFLKEKINLFKILGLFLIISGVIFIVL